MEMKGLKVEMKYLSIPECPEKTFKRSKREDFWKGRKKKKQKQNLCGGKHVNKKHKG